MVLPAPDGAETTNKIPLRVNCLLKVLDLLADLLELGFAKDNALRDRGVICLGAESIQLAKDLLGDELEGPADWLFFALVLLELREMAGEARQLFRDV